MSQLLVCPQGHEWEDPFGTGQSVFCPVCGACVDPSASAPSSVSNGASSSATDQGGTRSGFDTVYEEIQPQGPASGDTQAEGDGAAPALAEIHWKVAGYEILEVLGRGGMGVVYKARQTSLGRVVALKMILGGAHAGWSELQRFRSEAEVVARLQHPNIVQIHEIGEDNETPYFSMELVEGTSLAHLLDGSPQDPDRSAELVETLARAVHYAHQRNVVHRDLKPGNILLSIADLPSPLPDSATFSNLGLAMLPKVTDFGLAKVLGDDDSRTRTGEVLGTPSYMAPEQAAGNARDVGPPADIYALGAILFDLLTGRPPFKADNPVDTLVLVRTEEAPSLRSVHRGVPNDLETICLKCLRKKPDDRYASAQELAEDLRRYRENEPIHARPVGLWERGVKWSRRHKAWAALLVVCVFGSVFLLVFILVFSLYYNIALERSRNRAEANFQMALRAVDQMLTEVGHEDLAHVPHMEQKRRALLEKALTFYDKFLEDRGDDLAVRSEAALASKKAGDIRRELGQRDASRAAYEKAIALLTRLTGDFPGDRSYRTNLAECWNYLGELNRTSGDSKAARDAYEKAKALQQEMHAQAPDEAGPGQALARTWYNLGILDTDSGSLPQALEDFDQAIRVLKGLAKSAQNESEIEQELARVYLNQGRALRQNKNAKEAEDAWVQSIELLLKLKDKYPDRPHHQVDLAIAQNNLANLFARTDRVDKAKEMYGATVALLESLVRDYPSVPQYRKELANTLNSLGAVQIAKEPKEAIRSWTRATDIYAKLTADFPGFPDYPYGAGMAMRNRAWLHLRDKDYESAAKDAESALEWLGRASKQNPNQPNYQGAIVDASNDLAEARLGENRPEDAARVAEDLVKVRGTAGDYLLSATVLVRSNATLKRPNLTDRAIAFLRIAVGKDPALLEKLKKNEHLQPLHGLKEFEALFGP